MIVHAELDLSATPQMAAVSRRRRAPLWPILCCGIPLDGAERLSLGHHSSEGFGCVGWQTSALNVRARLLAQVLAALERAM